MEAASTADILDVLTLDRPEQLKALGHPLRLRVLELLGGVPLEELTNRELAERLGVDPGHLHFHVRMLLRAGLVQLAPERRGREKPYRPVAHRMRVAPELLACGLTSDVHSAILDEVQAAFSAYGPQAKFRTVQVSLRLDLERALELVSEFADEAGSQEDLSAESVVITAFVHPASRAPGKNSLQNEHEPLDPR